MKLSYHELDALLKPERAGEMPPVFVIVGSQDLLRELAVEKIVERSLDADPTPFNFERFDGAEIDGGRIVASANMMSMMGGRRVVVVKRAEKLVEKSEEIQAYVADPSPQTSLVLELAKSPDRRRKAWKEIEKATTVVACDAPKPAEVENWVLEQARARRLVLGRESVRYLMGEFGTDLRRLSNELEKLSLYASGDKLDLETIATVLGRGKAQSIFKYIDAVGAGDGARALVQLERLLEEGEPPLKILSLLDRLVGQLRVAWEHQGSGARSSGLAQALGVPPFAAKSLGEQARRFEPKSLRKAVALVADSDRTMKSSAAPQRLVLESLTLALCGGPSSATGPSRRRPRRSGG